MQWLTFTTVVLACAPLSTAISVTSSDEKGSKSAVLNSDGAMKMEGGQRLMRSADAPAKKAELVQADDDFCPGNKFPSAKTEVTISGKPAALKSILEKEMKTVMGDSEWKDGKEWTLSLTVSSTDAKPRHFGISGDKGFFLKFEVPANSKTQEITVHDLIEATSGKEASTLQYRSVDPGVDGEIAGKIVLSKICLQPSVCEGNKFPMNPFATYTVDPAGKPGSVLWSRNALKPLIRDKTLWRGEWTLSLAATSDVDRVKDFGFKAKHDSFLTFRVPQGVKKYKISTSGKVWGGTSSQFHYLGKDRREAGVVKFTDICLKKTDKTDDPVENEVDTAYCSSLECPTGFFKEPHAAELRCKGKVCGAQDWPKCCKMLKREKQGARCHGSEKLNWKTTMTMEDCVDWALNHEFKFFIYGQDNKAHANECGWQDTKPALDAEKEATCDCKKQGAAADEKDTCQWKEDTFDFFQLVDVEE